MSAVWSIKRHNKDSYQAATTLITSAVNGVTYWFLSSQMMYIIGIAIQSASNATRNSSHSGAAICLLESSSVASYNVAPILTTTKAVKAIPKL